MSPTKRPHRCGKILDRGHIVRDDHMSGIVSAIEQATGRPLTIHDIAYALSISNTRATVIRSITPKPRLNGSR